ncbi:MAG: hypothetical protein II625_07405 [Bacilli bacterium]|nr:hypothetical protein [Bacilli bacterium]
MNNNLDLNKKEGSILYQSMMSLISIIIFAIGVSLVTGVLLFLFTKIIGLNTSVRFQELLENELSIPDYFSNVLSYSICRIVLGGIAIPIVFFLAIRDRFKGSYMNLVDLKKYKLILCGYVVIYTLLFGGYYYHLYTNAVNQYVKYNAVIQENKADEKGYFNEGVKKTEILPKVVLIVFPIGGVLGIYITIMTADSVNKKYLMKVIQANQIMYNQGASPQVAPQPQDASNQSNIFY